MLPESNRMRRGDDFALTVRRGRRAGRACVVLHLVDRDGDEPARVGFVVSKAVGSAVTRNRVKRRLRHVVRNRLDVLPLGSLLVVRATPSAAGSTHRALEADVDGALSRLLAGARR